MKPDLVIGLDSSTTATKAIAWDKSGRAVAEGRASIQIDNPKQGWFEQDTDAWTNATAKAMKKLMQIVAPERIAAVAISSQRESFAQFDKHDKPLRPGTIWLDERATSVLPSLDEKLGAKTIHRISGKPLDVITCFARCAWFEENMPAMWKRTHKTAEVHGVVAHFLTNEWNSSTGSADPMGLLDMTRMKWSEKLVTSVGLSLEQLPKLFRPGEILGEISKNAARLTGLKQGTPVIAGGGDGQCAGTGTNVFVKGRAYINLGTAVVSGNYGRNYAYNPAFRTMTAIAEEGYIYETCLRSGTFLLNWAVERLFDVDAVQNPKIFTQLEKEARLSPMGSKGLMLVPYWSGVMNPYWDPAARGVIAGLGPEHRRGDIYRAFIEGLTFEQIVATEKVEAATHEITHYVAIGGGAKSDLWCQILADTSGKDVRRLETVEASSLGAACAAAKGVGWYQSIPNAAAGMAGKPSRTFRPRTRQNEHYRDLLGVYRDLWPTLSKWNAKRQNLSKASRP
jgi:sugar (pentulose or hexulose) kinase